MIGRMAIGLAVVLLIGAAPVQAQTALSGDYTAWQDWVADNDFTKAWGAQSLWGDAAGAAEHEVKIVGATTPPVYDQVQAGWRSGQWYDFRLVYDAALDRVSYTVGDWSVTWDGADFGGLNTLVFRASNKTGEGDHASGIADVSVTFDDGSPGISFPMLGGGPDGNYLIYQDLGVAGGFTATGRGLLTNPDGDAERARLMYEFKVGESAVVPEPMTVVLMATGLAGLGLVAYRRRREENPVA